MKRLLHRHAIHTALLVFLLSSCGGKEEATTYNESTSSTSTTTDATTPSGTTTTANTELINGIPVPPEPDPTANNATLAGIDVNGNGVRDDVERKIAEKYSANNEAYLLKAKIILSELQGIAVNHADFKNYICGGYSVPSVNVYELIAATTISENAFTNQGLVQYPFVECES